MDTALAQYGAVGVIATLAFGAVRVLFARVEKEQQRERDRADRLEAELRDLNKTIHTSYSAVLNDATRAVAEALAFLRRQGS
jgi:peptide subunit release factor 1 (eRF1)